jgi:glycosyltransferase involved in cell wall biosynthesis
MKSQGLVAERPLPRLSNWTRLVEWDDLFADRMSRRPMPLRSISVIVPAHNESAYIRRTLQTVSCQDYAWFEVIVVANGCTDSTPELARGDCDCLIVLSQKNLGVARNLGARMARGELLVFLDADTLLECNALRCIAEQFQQVHAAGTIRGQPDCSKPLYQAFYVFKNFLHRLMLHRGSSGVIICWKDQFLRVGGFDERLAMSENSHLMRSLCRWGRYRYIGGATATTSMRRFEQWGLARVLWVWIKAWLDSIFGDLTEREYEPVR